MPSHETRTDLFESLPKHGTILEVGVLHGGSSALILETCLPNLYYLIDCWRDQPRKRYADYREGYIGPEMLHGVMDRFVREIASGVVRPLVGMSKDIAKLIPNDSCDFIYLDGDHSYKGCLADIKAFWPKLKAGGIMAGHDYDDIDWSKRTDKAFTRTDWGVKSAVDEFFDEVNLILLPTVNWWIQKLKDIHTVMERNAVSQK